MLLTHGFLKNGGRDDPASPPSARASNGTVLDDEDGSSADLAALKRSIDPRLDKASLMFTNDKPIIGTMWFNIAVNSMTLVNTLSMGVEADHPEWRALWVVLENVFTAGFFIEMVIKLYVLRCEYFWDKANLLDGFLTILGVLDCWVFEAVDAGADGMQSLSILRILRLMRLARVAKLVRNFKPFVLVIHGMTQAMTTTCYVCMLLILIFYVFAIFLTDHLGHNKVGHLYPAYSTDAEVIDEMEIVQNYNPYLCFGSMGASMMTLFNMATGAEWAEIVRPVALKQGVIYVGFFIVFALVVMFGVMNVMIGMICDSVIAESKKLDEELTDHVKKEKLRTLLSLRNLIGDMDKDNDNVIDLKELAEAMGDGRSPLNAYLSHINFPCGWTPREMLDMLDTNGDGVLQKKELTTNLFRLMESDSFQEICIVQAAINQVKHFVRDVSRTIHLKFATIESDLVSIKDFLNREISPSEGPANAHHNDIAFEKDVESEPCCEPGEALCQQEMNGGFTEDMPCVKEAENSAELTTDQVAVCRLSTRSLCNRREQLAESGEQSIEDISNEQLAEPLKPLEPLCIAVGGSQWEETLDCAYKVMKECCQKELVTMKAALEAVMIECFQKELGTMKAALEATGLEVSRRVDDCITMFEANVSKPFSFADCPSGPADSRSCEVVDEAVAVATKKAAEERNAAEAAAAATAKRDVEAGSAVEAAAAAARRDAEARAAAEAAAAARKDAEERVAAQAAAEAAAEAAAAEAANAAAKRDAEERVAAQAAAAAAAAKRDAEEKAAAVVAASKAAEERADARSSEEAALQERACRVATQVTASANAFLSRTVASPEANMPTTLRWERDARCKAWTISPDEAADSEGCRTETPLPLAARKAQAT